MLLFQFFHHGVMAAGNGKDAGGIFYGHGRRFIQHTPFNDTLRILINLTWIHGNIRHLNKAV
jgi:hypothetical protein